jgi:DHA1 family tetracycline resistance protein-like MFS transporter
MPIRDRNPLIFIFVTRLIDAIGFGIVMPVLPQLLLHMGAPNIASAVRYAGLLLVVYAALQFICGPIIGNLSDHFGRRPVILGSLFAFGLDYTLMGVVPTIGWLFLGRAIAGIAGAVYVPANAFIADVTPPERRAHAFGIVGSAFGLGFILGPALGGFLGELGPRAPFFAAGALAGLNFLFGLFVLPESLPPERRRAFAWTRANPLGAALSIRKHEAVIGFAIATLLYLVGNNVYPSTWAFYMSAKFNWSPAMIGASLAVTGLGMGVVQAGLTGRIVHAIGEVRAALMGLSIGAAGCLVYALIPSGWMVFPVAIVGALQAVAYPSLNALMTRQVPANAQGELQGAMSSLTSLTSIVGPLLMTQTLAKFAAPDATVHFPGAAFVLAALLNLGAVAVLLTQLPRVTQEPAPATPEA